MATDLNETFRQIVSRQGTPTGNGCYTYQGATICQAQHDVNVPYGDDMVTPTVTGQGNQPTNTGIGFDTEKTPIITLALIGLGLYLLSKK